jgi:hypothetical protein
MSAVTVMWLISGHTCALQEDRAFLSPAQPHQTISPLLLALPPPLRHSTCRSRLPMASPSLSTRAPTSERAKHHVTKERWLSICPPSGQEIISAMGGTPHASNSHCRTSWKRQSARTNSCTTVVTRFWCSSTSAPFPPTALTRKSELPA